MNLEVQSWAETTTLYNLTKASYRDTTIVRIRYRPEGKRRWTKFFVVPQEGQSVDDLLARAEETAKWHATEKQSSTREET